MYGRGVSNVRLSYRGRGRGARGARVSRLRHARTLSLTLPIHSLSAPATRHVPMCAMSDVRARCARSRRSRGLAGHVHAARTVMGHSVSLARTRENRARSEFGHRSLSLSLMPHIGGRRPRASQVFHCVQVPLLPASTGTALKPSMYGRPGTEFREHVYIT